MQQNCAVHSRGVYWPALHDPHCPHKGQEQHRAHRTDRRQTVRRSWRQWYSCIRFFTNSILFSVSYMPPTSFPKNMPSILLSQKSPKKSFTYIGTKKAKNSHPKIKFFKKNLRAAETAPKREKNRLYYCIELRKIKPAIGSGNGIAYPLLVAFCN